MLVFVDEYPASLNVRHCLVKQKQEVHLSAQMSKIKQVFMGPLVHVGELTP